MCEWAERFVIEHSRPNTRTASIDIQREKIHEILDDVPSGVGRLREFICEQRTAETGNMLTYHDQTATDSSGSGPACWEILIFPAPDRYRKAVFPY